MYGSLLLFPVFSAGHGHFHTGRCNVAALPRELLEHHKAIITYVPIFPSYAAAIPFISS